MGTIITISVLVFIIVAMELSTFFVYGGFIDKEIEEMYMNLDESELRLNIYNPSILSTRYFITHVPFSFFVKYYINGIGTVPKWSKLHKKINHYFIVATKNSFLP